MEKALPSYDHSAEEEYIDMDLSSTTFLCYNVSSPKNSIEFEFQMSANPSGREAIPAPADELFYKGKLLPLQIPPRLQMVQNLLQNTSTKNFAKKTDELDEKNTNTAASTPFESCNISPAISCYVSGELNQESFLHQCSTNAEKSWSKKLKLIKQSSLGLKLKASRAYLKSLFTKSAFRDEPCEPPRAKQYSNGHMKAGKKNPFGQIHQKKYVVPETNAATSTTTTLKSSIDREKMMEEDLSHRKSFSGVIKWRLAPKSSSTSSSCSSSSSQSSSSASSNGFCQQPMLKRSSSANSEVESSVQGAIAYCKKSQQLAASRRSVSGVSINSLCS